MKDTNEMFYFKKTLRVFVPLRVIVFILLFSSQAYALAYEDYPVVRLRSLDKITARTMTFEAKVGSTVRFGEIFIKVQACRKPPPVEKSEAAAFLQVWQSNEAKDTSKWIFSGWMFASSPALSAMDHPVYDVWVLDCLGRDPEPVPVADTSNKQEGGVQTPVTDGAAPNAVPPAVEPDKQPVTDAAPVTRADDPGAYDEPPAQQSTPSAAVPVQTQDYIPSADQPDQYKDDTSADDTAPVDDTMKTAPQTTAPDSTTPEKESVEGIY